jgi:hypothetical protein
VKGRYLNANQQYRVLETQARPRFSSIGEFLGMIGVNVDVTKREEAERARELLVAELNHRVKNTLSALGRSGSCSQPANPSQLGECIAARAGRI